MFSPDPANAPKGYSLKQIRLHWIVALLIVTQFISHEGMETLWRALKSGTEPAFDIMIAVHIWGGVAVLALSLWRIALRRSRGFPVPPQDEPELLRRAAHYAHLALYAVLILFPVTGLIAFFGNVDLAAELHGLLEPLLILLVATHVAAALWHQFWLKDGLLLRMKRPLD